MSKHIFLIRVEVEGDDEVAHQAVEAALDSGILQDYINKYEHDEGEVKVTLAFISYAPNAKA